MRRLLQILICAAFFYSTMLYAQENMESESAAPLVVQIPPDASVNEASLSVNADESLMDAGMQPVENDDGLVDTSAASSAADSELSDAKEVKSAPNTSASHDVKEEASGMDANGETTEQTQEKEDVKFLKALRSSGKRDIKARIFGLYELSDKTASPNHFELSVARLNFEWSHKRYLKGVLKYDFANLVDQDDDGTSVKDGLRDAYVRIAPWRWLGVQMGQFKKPFSRFELTSRKDLPTISRGRSNDYMVEFLQYGDRDLGVMLSGRLIKQVKLEYEVGLFNGGDVSTADIGSGSKDVAFRLSLRPLKWLEVGASGSAHIIKEDDLAKLFDARDYQGLYDADYPVWLNPADPEGSLAGFKTDYDWLTGTHWMGELDLAVKRGGFEGVLESMVGENWWFQDSPYVWSIASVVQYSFPLFNEAMAIAPVVFAEMFHIEDETWTWKARMMQLTPGVNIHFGKEVRLMVHGQFVKTQGRESDFDEAPLRGFWPGEWPGSFVDSKSLFVQVGFAN